MKVISAQDIQRKYYTDMADAYNEMHEADVEHQIALTYVSILINAFRFSSVLDIGCGTGRGVNYFAARCPDIELVGVEPVGPLLSQAVQNRKSESSVFLQGSGLTLPFRDNSFDVVCEFAVLHHVANPNNLVREMMRVARQAIFISDSNRFGQGRPLTKIAKLLLHKVGLWPLANRIATRGNGYHISAGDGLFYSYSVFDSYNLVAGWADRVFMIPTRGPRSTNWATPLLTADQILVCAMRNIADRELPIEAFS
jgi:ubiquinone/menaquinone biosynthesis C-methylase UbiE